MIRRQLVRLVVVVAVMGGSATYCSAQLTLFPYNQNFDSVATPALPAGWTSSQNRTAGTNDFVTTTSSVRSTPHAVISTNATITQMLTSPAFDFSGKIPDYISFFTRRSSSHNAKVVVEASLDSGATFTIQLGDTLLNAGDLYVQVRVPLPAVLSSSRLVRFRWRVIAASAGATGTLRFDDLTISVQSPVDLTITRLAFAPLNPLEGDTVHSSVTVRNLGAQSASGATLQLYEDANNDTTPQPSELLRSVVLAMPVLAHDSSTVNLPLGTFAAGNKLIVARVAHSLDGDTLNNKRFATLHIGYRSQSVVINEIMYAPTSAEPEWVELHNLRSDSINLRNWLLSDNIVSSKRVVSSQNALIPPNGYMVLTRDSTALVDVHPTIRAKILTVSGFPSLNNSGDAVVLYGNLIATMDSVAYLPAWGGGDGKSLERIESSGPSTVQTNWGTSRNVARSSPGERNSLARKDRDLAIDTVFVAPNDPVVGDSLRLSVRVKNPGFQTVGSAIAQIFLDANRDSIAQPSELVASQALIAPIPALDSVELNFRILVSVAGIHVFIHRIEYPADEDTINNTKATRFLVGYPFGAVRINEITYAPNTGFPEWIELLNTRADTINAGEWSIGNRSSSSRYEIADFKMPPNRLVVITKDTALFRAAHPSVIGHVVQTSSLPTFLWNNSADAVVVVDGRDMIVDSVFYRSSWGGGSGKSLERIDALAAANDSSNWATSVDSSGATPTRHNSHVALDNDLRLVRVSSDTVHAGEPARLTAIVRNVGKNPCTQFTIFLFDDRNRDSLASTDEQFQEQTFNNTITARESVVVVLDWSRPESGVHRVIAKVSFPADERRSNDEAFSTVAVGFRQQTLVINEIMYAPLASNAEYIEFYNAGEIEIDVAGWEFHDRLSAGVANVYSLATKPKKIRPGELFILASDSSVKMMNPSLDVQHFSSTNSTSLSLNNDGDDIVLLDPTGAVIDSVRYSSQWHNPEVFDKSGRALEKINPLLPSGISRNWTTCVNTLGGTPGYKNSVYTTSPVTKATISVWPNPFSPDGDGWEDFAVIHYELPMTVATIRVRIYDSVGRYIRTLANNEQSGPKGEIVWDGLDEEKQRARIGMYILLLDAIDPAGGVVKTLKAVIVLASKL